MINIPTGLSIGKLRRTYGLDQFIDHDALAYDDPQELGKRALRDLCLDSSGGWCPDWAVIFTGVERFMQREDFKGSTREQKRDFEQLITKSLDADPEAIETWFDRAYPPAKSTSR